MIFFHKSIHHYINSNIYSKNATVKPALCGASRLGVPQPQNFPEISGPRRASRFGLPGTQNFREILGLGLCPLKGWASSTAASRIRSPKFLENFWFRVARSLGP